jgi:hypothetical protein
VRVIDKVKEKTPEEIIEEDLDALEQDLRQLKVRYDQFFYGNQKLPPTMQRSQVDKRVRKFANTSMRTFLHRYRFNNLLIRYQAYSELWNRRMRTYEEGERKSVAARNLHEFNEELVARTRVSDPKGQSDQLREIYDKFIAARTERDPKKKPVSFDKFVRGVAGQAAQLRKSSGCGEIELRLVIKNDQVQLKARPGD